MKTGTFFQRLMKGIWRTACRPDWERFVETDWQEQIMTLPVTDRFHAKQGRSTGRLILRHEDQRLAVYLKRHYRLPWWRGLLSLLWPRRFWSPAMQEAANLEWARRQNLKVPEVVAVGERIGPLGGLQSALAVEELKNMLPLHEAIPLAASRLDAAVFARWKRSLIQELARIARALHHQYYFHKDLYLCHFYIDQNDTLHIPTWQDRVYLIDLHRLARHRWFSSIWQSKDLAQLMYSSDLAGITARDRLRFWRHYLGGGNAGKQSWLRKLVLYRWRRYHRHNEKRKLREQQRRKAA